MSLMGHAGQSSDRVGELEAEVARLRTLLRQAGLEADQSAWASSNLKRDSCAPAEEGAFLRAIVESSTNYAILTTY
jgi:hypothetical protein